MRIGHGYDVHAFEPGDSIVLGGVRIPHGARLRAHSDGDVLLHALTDALYGAAAMGDIGRHFPDTDAAYKGVDSMVLLQTCVSQLAERSLYCSSADMTIVAEAPKLASHVDRMAENIATVLGCPRDRVNVKATTSERLGFCGREEGIAAYAVVLLDEPQHSRG